MRKSRYRSISEKMSNQVTMREMANLDTDDTGIDHGHIYISTKEGNHGARVKYFRGKPGEDKPSASILIDKDTPKVVEDNLKKGITSKELSQVQKFVKLNYTKLIRFWVRGTSMTRKEVNKFIDNLTKVEE